MLISLSKSTSDRLSSSGGTLSGDLTGTNGTFTALTAGNITATGTLTASGALVNSSTATSTFAGAVGIGTTSPSQALTVSGNSLPGGRHV